MKITSTSYKITALASAFIFLFASVGLPQVITQHGGVTVTREPGGHAIRTTTNSKGKATFSKLEPGHYTVGVLITPDMAQPQSAGSPATTTEVIAKITANGRTITSKPIPVTSTTKAGWVDFRTNSGKKITITIKKGEPQKIGVLIGLLLPEDTQPTKS